MASLMRGTILHRQNSALQKYALSLLHLPPSIRTRSFHAAPRLQIYDSLVTSAHTLFDSVHAFTGLPWVYAIPLSALLIRTTLVLPIAIYSRRRIQKQADLFPLIASWNHTLRKETMAEVGQQGPVAAQQLLIKKTRKKRNEIYKRWGCQSWKVIALPLSQLPVFLIAIEAMRRMCGTREGLLGMTTSALSNWTWGSKAETATTAQEATISDASYSAEISDLPGPFVEPSLATEGALWFPNLLVADPELILPFVLSGAILLNIFGKVPGKEVALSQNKWQIRLKRTLGLVALATGPLTLQIPSGMLVYWISSTSLAYLQAIALQVIMPIKKTVTPCQPKRRSLKFGKDPMEEKG